VPNNVNHFGKISTLPRCTLRLTHANDATHSTEAAAAAVAAAGDGIDLIVMQSVKTLLTAPSSE